MSTNRCDDRRALALSVSFPIGDERVHATRARVDRLLADIAGEVTVIESAATLTVLGGTHIVHRDGDRWWASLSGPLRTTRAGLMSDDLVTKMLARGELPMADIAAPACLVHGDRSGVVWTVDRWAAFQAAYCTADGWSAASTSNLLLARLAGAAVDEDALAIYALFGHFVGNRGPHRGVRFVDPATALRLEAGRASAMTPSAVVPASPATGTPSHGADVLRAAMTSAVEAYPDAVLELTGGMDSRLLLAALPPELRAGRRAVTFETPGSDDAELAVRAATIAGLEHELLPRLHVPEMSADAAVAACMRGVERCDALADPLKAVGLGAAEGVVATVPRIGGLNGEFVRGLHYDGLPVALLARTPPGSVLAAAAVRPVVELRMANNQRVSAALFSDGFLAEGRRAAVEFARREMVQSGAPDFLSATDEFRLAHRSRRWVGGSLTRASATRHVLAPFFDPAFIAWARAADPRLKANSRLAALTVEQLDDRLAALPISDGRPAPSRSAHPTLRLRAERFGALPSRAVRTIRRRVTASGKSDRTIKSLSMLVVEGWRAQPAVIDAVTRLPFVDPAGVEAILDGRTTVNAATIGMLANLAVIAGTDSDLS